MCTAGAGLSKRASKAFLSGQANLAQERQAFDVFSRFSGPQDASFQSIFKASQTSKASEAGLFDSTAAQIRGFASSRENTGLRLPDSPFKNQLESDLAFQTAVGTTGGTPGGIEKAFFSGGASSLGFDFKQGLSTQRVAQNARIAAAPTPAPNTAEAPRARDQGRGRQQATVAARRDIRTEDASLAIRRRGKQAITNVAGLGIGDTPKKGGGSGLNIPS
jgi:hypothetical protein